MSTSVCYYTPVDVLTSAKITFSKASIGGGKTMTDRFKTFTILINKISSGIRKIKMLEMEKFGLKSAHVSCLYYLYTYGGSLTARQLCDICEEDKAAISRSIDFLEKNDYLSCDAKQEKRYNSPLQLTKKGKAIGEEIHCKIDSLLEEASGGLSEENRQSLYSSLELISKNIEKIIENKEA